MTKTYTQLKEETLINELRIIRAGAALLYANKVKDEGNKSVSEIRKSQDKLRRVSIAKSAEEKLDIIADGISTLGNAIIHQRMVLGNMTGISVVSALLAERTDKQLMKLLKGKGRR